MKKPTSSRLTLASLLLLGWLSGACCAPSRDGSGRRPTAATAIAEVALILDLEPDAQRAFHALSPEQQNEAVDQAWTQVRRDHSGFFRELGTHDLDAGGDGWPMRERLRELVQRIRRSGGMPGDEDPPRGCQYDESRDGDGTVGTIKCDHAIGGIRIPGREGLPELSYSLGFSIHCRFRPRNRP